LPLMMLAKLTCSIVRPIIYGGFRSLQKLRYYTDCLSLEISF
jgi:hypothetical protein